MGIRHKFTSSKPEGADSSVVRPSNWNDDHNFPPLVVPLVNASVTWTNMPNAATEFTGLPRTKYDLTHSDQVRLVVCVGVATAAAATLKIQYSTDQAAWSDLTSTLGSLNSTGAKAGAWENVPAGAKADVFLRVQGAGGDGTLDPQFRLIQLQVR